MGCRTYKQKGEVVMDTTKYKSVATKMDTYNKAKIIANHSHRSIGAVISMLVDQEWSKQKPQVKKELKSAA
jgi:hypothetical protein